MRHHQGKAKAEASGAEVEAEPDADSTEEHCSRACSSWLAQLALLYNPGPHAWEWHLAPCADLPTPSSIKKMLPQTHL